MTRLGPSLAALGFCCLTGCAGRAVDLDRKPPASSAATSSAPFVAPTDEAVGVWVDDQRLYWATVSSVQSCLKLDCEHTRLTYATLQQAPSGATVGGGHVYWTSAQSTIFSCPVEGCAAEPVTVVRDPSLLDRIFPNRGYVYWSSDFDIYRCPASGCAAVPEVVAESAGADYLVFDETHAYWRDATEIVSAASDGSEPPQIVTGAAEVAEVTGEVAKPDRGLAVGEGYLYWATGKQVFRCPIANCDAAPPTLLVTGEAPITALELDGSAMYWLEADAIHSCPLIGCNQSVTLTPPKVAPRGTVSFAIDASYVYWLELADDTRESPLMPEPTLGKWIRRTGK